MITVAGVAEGLAPNILCKLENSGLAQVARRLLIRDASIPVNLTIAKE
jgi:hypothetical protein